MNEQRLKIAIQKSGRLHDSSIELLKNIGFEFELRKHHLVLRVRNQPIDLYLIRDDDIPGFVEKGVCDLGIVGLNELVEFQARTKGDENLEIIRCLGFGLCRLVIAGPEKLDELSTLRGQKIATSYPYALSQFLADELPGLEREVEIIEISGAVEITPNIGLAGSICDLVSTGQTLKSNGLQECFNVLQSEAVLIHRKDRSVHPELVDKIVQRSSAVERAEKSKYLMLNAPREQLDEILEILPGMDSPTVIPLAGKNELVAVHAVTSQEAIWEIMESLKSKGASSIVVMPIEKMVE